jgi:putative acetyltransferase
LINEAKSVGYRKIVLDTGCRQIEAQNLYRSLGFEEIGPYYDMPQEVKDMLVFVELKLGNMQFCIEGGKC